MYLPMPVSSGAKLIPWRRIFKTDEKNGVGWKAAQSGYITAVCKRAHGLNGRRVEASANDKINNGLER